MARPPSRRRSAEAVRLGHVAKARRRPSARSDGGSSRPPRRLSSSFSARALASTRSGMAPPTSGIPSSAHAGPVQHVGERRGSGGMAPPTWGPAPALRRSTPVPAGLSSSPAPGTRSWLRSLRSDFALCPPTSTCWLCSLQPGVDLAPRSSPAPRSRSRLRSLRSDFARSDPTPPCVRPPHHAGSARSSLAST